MAMLRKENLLSFAVIAICTLLCCVSGKYNIQYAPDYMKYLPTDKSIDLSEIPLVIKSSFGFSTENDFKWSGLAQNNPFKRPKAQVLFSLESSRELSPYKHSFLIKNDVGDVNTELVSEHMRDAMSGQSLVIDFSQPDTLFDMQSRHPSVFSHIPNTVSKVQAIFTNAQTGSLPFTTASLNVTVTEDLKFLAQLYLINAIVDAIAALPDLSRDSYPDFYHFRVDGVRDVEAKYGSNSQQITDAENILRSTIERVSATMQELYKGNVVIQVVNYDVTEDDLVKLRSIRSLQAADQQANNGSFEKRINVSDGYDENYPIAFNTILWTMIILAITVLGVAAGIWNMDPGHDSIIYRMTSQRLKRD